MLFYFQSELFTSLSPQPHPITGNMVQIMPVLDAMTDTQLVWLEGVSGAASTDDRVDIFVPCPTEWPVFFSRAWRLPTEVHLRDIFRDMLEEGNLSATRLYPRKVLDQKLVQLVEQQARTRRDAFSKFPWQQRDQNLSTGTRVKKNTQK